MLACRAGGKLHRQVLLDGHELVQVGIIGPVGDAEPPGPQHRIQPVFLKAGARRQGVHVVDGHGEEQASGVSGWIVSDCRTGAETLSMCRVFL